MLYLMKHGVIGSGPCGALAALLLLEAGFAVDLIDVDNNQKIDDPNLNSKLKLVDGDSSPYDINQILEIEIGGKPATFYRSKVEAGFSRVWGATWNSPLVSLEDSWGRNYSKVDEIVSRNLFGYPENLGHDLANACGCDCLSFLPNYAVSGEKFLQVSDLAVRNLSCGCIASGKSICVHGSIWNSNYLIQECKKFTNFTFRRGIDVTNLTFEKDGILIDNPSGSLSYDSLTLAAGPLGTTEILLNSFSAVKEITLSETRMGFIPFFSHKLNTGHVGAFAFSQLKFDLKDEKNLVVAHVQLYAHSELYSERIEGKFPAILVPFVRQLIKFLAPHMGIALIYLNSNYSESLKVRKSSNSRKLLVDLVDPLANSSKISKRIWESFRKLGLIPLIPALSWAKPGESYHLGAERELLDDFGFLKMDKRVSVAGTFALPVILPGPVTHAAMAQSSRLVEKIVYQNFESI
jgi:hypothetical protein